MSESGLWSRLKGASQAISALSLSSEKDGDSENDTVIHNALVKFYLERDGQCPTWLEPEDVGRIRSNHSTFSNRQRTSASSFHSADSSRSAPEPARGNIRTTQASSLQDLYMRRGSASTGGGSRSAVNSTGSAGSTASASSGGSLRPPTGSYQRPPLSGAKSAGSTGGGGWRSKPSW